MDEDLNNDISPQSFQECGRQIYEDDISYTYNMIVKKVLEEKYECLTNELRLVNNEINDLNSNIADLTSNYYLNTKKLSANTSNLMFLKNRYGVTIFQFNKFVNEMKKNVMLPFKSYISEYTVQMVLF
jgi:hypothetical protein